MFSKVANKYLLQSARQARETGGRNKDMSKIISGGRFKNFNLVAVVLEVAWLVSGGNSELRPGGL
jgi:hypothetical protein